MSGWLFLTAPYYFLRHCVRWLLWRRTARVKLIYKSGAVQHLRCNWFKVTRDGGTITTLEWKNPLPEPLHAGVDDLAAVYSN